MGGGANPISPVRYISFFFNEIMEQSPDSKVYGTNMGPTWGRQDPGGSHVSPMKLAIWVVISSLHFDVMT